MSCRSILRGFSRSDVWNFPDTRISRGRGRRRARSTPTRSVLMHSTLSTALLRELEFGGLALFQFFGGERNFAPRTCSRGRIDIADGRLRLRGAKTIIDRWRAAEAAREARIVPHNFRLASRPEELQLPKLHVLCTPVEFRRLHPPPARGRRAFRGVGRILLKENSVPCESLKDLFSSSSFSVSSSGAARAGNLKVHGKLFAGAYNAISFV